jgi:hypothetical protein
VNAKKSARSKSSSACKKPPARPRQYLESTGCTRPPPAQRATTLKKWRDTCWENDVSTASC